MFIDYYLLAPSILLFILLLERSYQTRKIKRLLAKAERELNQYKMISEGATLDITESTQQFIRDHLTGLPSRQVFEDRLTQALNNSQRNDIPLGVMILDIDNLSGINQQYSYEVGDEIIRELASRFEKSIRQVDTVSRFAGGRFLFLLPQLSKPETVAYVAQRVQDAIFKGFQVGEHLIYLKASIGIAVYPADGADAASLLRAAEKTVNDAKASGGNCYQFHNKEFGTLGRREIILHEALRNPDYLQKMVIYYQPYIHIHSHKVICVQPIPHLQHDELGLVAWSDFSSVAENAGKALEILEWTLAQSATQFKKWHSIGFKPEHLVFDISSRHIQNQHFYLYTVSKIINEMKLSPGELLYVIADDRLSKEEDSLENIFVKYREAGIQMAVSIFALGHFALQKNTRLPINYLKIDRKLIWNLQSKNANEPVLNMIVAHAKDLKIDVIAEGVENEAQKSVLKGMGCEVMQGGLFGPPIDNQADINSWLTKQQA